MTNTERTTPESPKQATMTLESEAERQAFLAKAGRTLLSSLDYRETLQRLADLAVPSLGDWCAVDMVREDGTFARLAVAHTDPQKVQLAHELWNRYPPKSTDPTGLANVLRTGAPEMLAELPDAMLEAGAQDPEHLAIVKSLGLKAYMILPLTAKDTVLGALTLVQAESGRSYREDELPFAAEFAKLAAIAVDNARLFEGQIEARARAEASEETFRTFIDNLPGLAWTALADGYIDFYNRGWYEYTGTTFAEMQGWGWAKVHDPEFLPKVTARWKESIETGQPFEMEFPLVGADKLPRWFLTRVNPLRDKTGKIVRWFGTNTDVDDIRSARALAEEMAAQSHDTARELLELRRQKEHAEQRVAQLEAEIANRRS